eukprot:g7953.t1
MNNKNDMDESIAKFTSQGLTPFAKYIVKKEGTNNNDNNQVLLFLSTGNICKFTGNAIVNAANNRNLGGGGVDGAISEAGGKALYDARLALPIVEGSTRVKTGDAKITIGGELLADYVIHAVGPNYHTITDSKQGDKLLYNAYASSISEAENRNEIESMAFPLISAGVYKGNQKLEHVLRIGVSAIVNSVSKSTNNNSSLKCVHIIGYTRGEQSTLKQICDEVFSSIETNNNV